MSLSVIPQIFYDLIARVIPGFVMIITWYLTIVGPSEAINTIKIVYSKQDKSNFWLAVLLFILSYVLSFILDELWPLFRKIRKIIRKITKGQKEKDKEKERIESCIAENNKIRKCFGESELEFENKDWPSFWVIYGHLRLYSQSEVYRLLKLRAEAQLCTILFIGFLPLPIINILFWYNDPKLLILDRIFLELAVIVAILAFWRGRNKFKKFYIVGTYRSWLFFSFPIGPLKQTKAERPKN